MVRRWLSGLIAVGVLVGTGLTTAAAEPLAPGPAAALVVAPTTGVQGSRTLAASENQFPDTGGELILTGTGFDASVDLYLAVCQADITPADALTYCLGGQIPDDNDTTAWAVVTADPDGKQNAVAFTVDGSFSATLTLDAPVGSSVDCIAAGCVVIARTAGEQAGRPADILIPITFQSTGPTTTDNGGEVGPDAVSLPQAQLGDQQAIVFSGFTPDEAVSVTLFSDPITLPGVTATASGVVTVSFRITEQMLPGQHVLQAVGSESNRFGVAYFEVLAAPPATTGTPTPTTTESSATTTSAPSSTTTATPTSTATETATPTTTTSNPVVPVSPGDSGRNLWWLWVALIAVVVVGAVTGVSVLSRRRKEQLAEEERQREQELQDAAAEPSWRAAGTEAYPGTEPYDDGGLLSGRSGPGPDLYGGSRPYPPAAPTTRLPPPTADLPTQAIPPPGPVQPSGPTVPPGGTQPDGGDPVGDTDFWLRELGTDGDDEDPPRR